MRIVITRAKTNEHEGPAYDFVLFFKIKYDLRVLETVEREILERKIIWPGNC